MIEVSSAPEIADFEIPIDSWTQPFWDAAAQERLLLPRCTDCGRFRWPPGPFCSHCQSQQLAWVPAGPGRIYSFTIVRDFPPDGSAVIHVPALIEFPECEGIRLIGAIVDTPVDALRIGAVVIVAWSPAANAMVPVFRLG